MIVRALLEGEQIVDVRKGGIQEEGRHFGLQAPRLWLYPTYLHQQEALLKPAYASTLRSVQSQAPPEGTIVVPGWAEVVGVATVTEPEHLAALDSKLIWSLDYAASRLKWKRRDPLWVLALRTYVLDAPLEIGWREEYGGCTSWVDLVDLPDDPASLPSRTALSDTAFEARLNGVVGALPGGLDPPAA